MEESDEPVYVELARDGVDSEAVAAIAQAEAQRDRNSPLSELIRELNIGQLAQSAIGLMQAQQQAQATAQAPAPAPEPQAASPSQEPAEAATDGGPKTRTEKRLEEMGVKDSDDEEPEEQAPEPEESGESGEDDESE